MVNYCREKKETNKQILIRAITKSVRVAPDHSKRKKKKTAQKQYVFGVHSERLKRKRKSTQKQ